MKKSRIYSINAKLRLLIFLAMLVLLVAIVIVMQFTVNEISRKEERATIQEIARGKAAQIGEWLSGTNAMLRAYAETAEMKSDDWDIIRPLLIKAYNRINDERYLFLAYVQANGKGWTSRDKWLDARPLPYYPPLILENKAFFITNPFVGATTNKALIIVAHAVIGPKGKNQGIMIAGIEGSSISSIAEKINIGGEGFGIIVDNAGVFVAYPDVEKVMKMNIRELDKEGYKGMGIVGEEMSHGLENVREYTHNGKNNFIIYTPIPNSPNWTLGIMIPASYFNRTARSIFLTILPIAVAVFLLTILITLKVTGSISKPLKKTAAALKDIAQGEGDLTVRLPLQGNDEITELSRYFNETIKKIAETVKAVSFNASSMKTLATDLSTNMGETQNSITRINTHIDGVKKQLHVQSTSVTETSSAMEEINTTILSLSEHIDNQSERVKQSSLSIDDLVKSIADVSTSLKTNQSRIDNLKTKTDELKTIFSTSEKQTQEIASQSEVLSEATNVIQNIASQTNLLAMNAAIEAAHAGDAGKGFAVVADEIRKLAEESTAQSKQITQVLKTFKANIENIAGLSLRSSEIVNETHALTEEVKAQEDFVMEAMHNQNAGSVQVQNAMNDINDITSEVQQGSSEMLEGTKNVSSEMQELKNITNTINININMNEMLSLLSKITDVMQYVNQITQQNQNNIDVLVKEVNKFKV